MVSHGCLAAQECRVDYEGYCTHRYDSCWIRRTRSLSALRFFSVTITAAVRYRKMCGHTVWIVLAYSGFVKNMSIMSSRPVSVLTKTKRDQWINQVRCCSCSRADAGFSLSMYPYKCAVIPPCQSAVQASSRGREHPRDRIASNSVKATGYMVPVST
jgi:hypothetical protein